MGMYLCHHWPLLLLLLTNFCPYLLFRSQLFVLYRGHKYSVPSPKGMRFYGHMVLSMLDTSCLNSSIISVQSPHYTFWVNHLKAGLAAQLLWASMMFAALVFSNSHERNDDVTALLFSASVPAAVLGASVSWIFLHWRLRSISKFERYVQELKNVDSGDQGSAPVLRNVRVNCPHAYQMPC